MFSLGVALAVAVGAGDSETLPITQFVSPWEVQLMQLDENCPQLCTEWAALFFSPESGCTGEGVDGNASFCPDTEAVDVWTVEQELEYEAMHGHREELEVFELEVFDALTLERQIKLSVKGWRNFVPVNVNADSVEIRRLGQPTPQFGIGSSWSYHCVGGNYGRISSYQRGRRPYAMYIRSGEFIDSLTFMYPHRGSVRGGGHGGKLTYVRLPDCINVILIRAGAWVDSVLFTGNGKATHLYGGIGGNAKIVVAPSGKCLGDIRLRHGRYIDQICMKFNGRR